MTYNIDPYKCCNC